MFKKYVERLFLLGILNVENDLEWGTFPLHNLNLNQIEYVLYVTLGIK